MSRKMCHIDIKDIIKHIEPKYMPKVIKGINIVECDEGNNVDKVNFKLPQWFSDMHYILLG